MLGRSGEEASDAAAMAGGRVGIGGARVGLTAGPSGFVEGLADAWSFDSLKLKASLSFVCLPLLFN